MLRASMRTLIAVIFAAFFGLNVCAAQPTNAESVKTPPAASTNAVTVRFDSPTEKVIRDATDNAVETILATFFGGVLAIFGGLRVGCRRELRLARAEFLVAFGLLALQETID